MGSRLSTLLLFVLALATPIPGLTQGGTVGGPETEVEADLAETLDGRTVAEVTWTGANVTKDFVISRELRVRAGEPFSSATLADDVQRLENLGIFAGIQVAAIAAGDEVRVEYYFRETPSYIPYLAFTFTEENGWSVGPAISSVNLTGRNIQTAGRALFGGTNTFLLNGHYPSIAAQHVSLDLALSYLVRDDKIRDFEEQSVEVTPWIGNHLGENGRMAWSASYFRMRSDRDGVTLSPSNVDEFGRLGLRLGYDSRDSWVVPRAGWRNEIEVIQSGGFMGGKADFLTFTTDVRKFLPLWGNTLAIGGLVTLQSGTVGEKLPSYMDFRMGGANSIRGYDVDKLGRELFGKNQFIATAEWRRTIMPVREIPLLNWSFRIGVEGAVFVDVGTAWSEPEELTGDRYRTGGGVGIRLVGLANEMLRLDLGFGDETAIFHFGSWSKFTAQRGRLR
jgi:outer membrane protein insertion porin family